MSTLERSEILDLLAAGTISAAEAASLLDKANRGGAAGETTAGETADLKAAEAAFGSGEIDVDEVIPASSPKKENDPFTIKVTEDDVAVMKANGDRPKWLKIRVSSRSTGKQKVNISIPIGLVNFGLGIARRFAPDDQELDLDEMWQMVKTGERGVLVNIEDEEDDEHVQIALD